MRESEKGEGRSKTGAGDERGHTSAQLKPCEKPAWYACHSTCVCVCACANVCAWMHKLLSAQVHGAAQLSL